MKTFQKEVPSEQEGDGNFVLTLKDAGIGMSKEFQEHLFEDFTRDRNKTDSKVVGTGLGMAIVNKYVDMMKGTIEVESEPGEGTTFYLTFSHKIAYAPIEEHKELDAEANQIFEAKGRRILLAEDNELNVEIAIEILEDEGFILEHAVDGIQCVDMLKKADSGY